MTNRDGRYPTTATRGKLVRALEQLESFRDSYRLNGVTNLEFTQINVAISEVQEVENRMYRTEQGRKAR